MHSPSPNPPVSRLTPLDSAFEAFARRLAPSPRSEMRADQAIGFVLAADLRARQDIPASPIALESGWAVDAEDVAGAGAYGPAILSPPPAWVDANGRLPAAANTVLAPECVTNIDSLMAEAIDSAPPGHNVRGAGEDVSAGAVILAEGSRVGPRHVSLIRACGFERVMVRAPQVRLVLASESAAQHLDMVRAWLRAAGAIVAEVDSVAHDDTAMAAGYSLSGAHLILSVGGVGQARADRAVATFRKCGALQVHGLALRPGHEAALGETRGTPVILLPDRLDGLIAGMLTLVDPALALLQHATGQRPPMRVALTGKVSSTIGLTELFLALPSGSAIQPVALDQAGFEAIAGASGWFAVPPGSEGFSSGDTVEIRPFDAR